MLKIKSPIVKLYWRFMLFIIYVDLYPCIVICYSNSLRTVTQYLLF